MKYQLPHALDRPGQQEALDWILNSDKQFLILCAPTGLGKTALAAMASTYSRTMALVLHKALQTANYGGQYQFDLLFGKSNYSCEEKYEIYEDDFIHFPDQTAYDCTVPFCNCPYQRQKAVCAESWRVSVNYAKYLASHGFRNNYRTNMTDRSSGIDASYLFLDEAHNLPDIVLNQVGISVNWNNRFLETRTPIKPQPSLLSYEQAMTLFRQCARAAKDNKPDKREDIDEWRKWKRFYTKLVSVNSYFDTAKDWYYETNDKALIIKPLTSKYHFKDLFNADRVILMSATITSDIAGRLGISDDEFDFMKIENPWPVPSRFIYDMNGPKMNYDNGKKEYIKRKHAKLAMSVLKPDKSGIIHVMSQYQAESLQWQLQRINKNRLKFWMPIKGTGTEKQYEEWTKERKPGTYCISWNFHEGADLGDDDITIMAKTPFTSLGSDYEKARLKYDPEWYKQKTAYVIEQMFGRFQRGKPEHYTGNKKAYIIDGSWHKLKPYLSIDFKKRIRNYEG